ncbi:serine/threonine-protein kinase [Actinoallomurus sp. NPDC050550]|uniref:serine/threonine-protein kinase n=1 Tax=Actinoallomurus sp. NPDC050550 TaxID=3154937 RepID=UPI0033D5910C
MRAGLELGGRYRLEALLGRGGMGEVWRGVDLRLGRSVAVKMLPLTAAADASAVARFRREAEVAATLNHPGITTVFDIDEHHDQDSGQHAGQRLLFLVMELMQGRDLATVLATQPSGGLPVAQVTDWAVQILDALSVAHGRGVVHRDIKPANLFVVEGGRIKICDFGIARLAGATKITATGSVAGTPLYMAPEQIQARPLDQRTDLYAFGCVLYEMLAGTVWVDTSSGVGSVLFQHLNQPPSPPRSVRPHIPDLLDTLVLALLAKHPDGRPSDAATAAEALRALSAQQHPALGRQPAPAFHARGLGPAMYPAPNQALSPPAYPAVPGPAPEATGRASVAGLHWWALRAALVFLFAVVLVAAVFSQ